MDPPKTATSFSGSGSSHAVATLAPRRRDRPAVSTVHLTADEAAAVSAFLDQLVLARSEPIDEAANETTIVLVQSNGDAPPYGAIGLDLFPETD